MPFFTGGYHRNRWESEKMVIGLTGGVGSGKDLVAGEFERLGAVIIDADTISREVMAPGGEAYPGVVEEFGEGILNADRTIDRKILGAIVFNDTTKLKRLNAIALPAIKRIVEGRIEELRGEYGDTGLIVLNAPLLIEVGHHRIVDKVIVVYCEEEAQLKRVMARDDLTESEARARINAQISLDRKVEYADFVVDNDGSKEDTLKRVGEVYGELKNT